MTTDSGQSKIFQVLHFTVPNTFFSFVPRGVWIRKVLL